MLDTILKIMLSSVATLTAVAALGGFIFGIRDSIHNGKHRVDLNHNLRKDIHIAYINMFDELMLDIEKNGEVTDRERIIQLISHISSPSGRIKINKLKKRIFNKRIILKELKDMSLIKNDFKINNKLTMSLLLKELDIKNIKLNKKHVSELLIIIATAVFTEQIDLLNYDEKYEPIVEFIIKFNRTPKSLMIKYI